MGGMMKRLSLVLAALAVFFAFLAMPLAALAQTDSFSILADFTDASPSGTGGLPSGNLVQAPDGNFYGEDIVGGTNDTGVVFRLTPAGALSAFYNPASGAVTPTSITVGGDGYIYAALTTGGTDGYGSVIKISPAGVATTLHEFTFGADGADPVGVLVQGSDGNYYGEASEGGNDEVCENFFGTFQGGGTIYKITPAGVFSVLYTFNGTTDGCAPQGGLVQGSDGNYYGMTGGTFFKYVMGGALTTIGTITTSDQGAQPFGPLVEDANANFYVPESVSGANGEGTILEVSVANGLSIFYTFCSQANCADGGTPYAPLFLGTDGNFYGSTFAGNNPGNCAGFGCGTLYKITTGGTLTVLDSTTDADTAAGLLPTSNVIQGSNGYLYTTLSHGGSGANSDQCGGDNCGVAVVSNTGLTAPVVLTLSSSSVPANTPVTLSYKVSEAITVTSQQCYAFESSTAGGNWTGKQSGAYSSSTHAWTGSASVTPTANGTYTYALTCGGTVSGFATLTVAAAKKSSTTELTATPSTLSVGQSVTLKATVSGSAGTPAGSVTFSFEGATLATVSLSGGVASLPASSNGYPPGSYPIIATYSGSSTYNTSASTATTVTLNEAPTTTTLTASPNPVTPPAAETLTATVKRSASGATGVPAGSVTFSISGTKLATVNLNGSGVATLAAATNGVGAGTYPVIATYSGDSSDVTSASSAVNVVVK